MVKSDIIAMAAKNLMRRKARTFLTMLGVLIGTTSIVVMVSLGLGLQNAQQQMIQQWGSLNEITVNQSYSMGDEQEKAIVLDDAALESFRAMNGVTAVIPMVQISANTATCGKMQGWLQVYGIEPEAMTTMSLEAAHGRLLQPNDKNVLVLGGMIGDGFYDPNGQDQGYDPEQTWEEYQAKAYNKTVALLDKKITAEFMNFETEKSKKVSFQVVGILPQGSNNNSYNAYAPLEVVQKLQKMMLTSEEKKKQKRDVYSQITLMTADVNDTKTILQSVKDLGYNAYSIADQLKGIEDQARMIQIALGGIGGITLLVAAIGIINTMVMSIYERTKEIAIMKVIGATFNDIRLLFLAEAGMIGFFGGLLGLALSYGLSFVINGLAAGFMQNFVGGGEGLSLSLIPWWLALFAIVFSILVGLLAGVYPANKAVRLSPIEAMRNN